MSPTQRSLDYLRRAGYLAQVVEHWNPHGRRRVDLFGIIDILCVNGGPGVLGVQTTTTTNLSHRFAKLQTECADAMIRWLAAGNGLVFHGWAKQGPRGRRKTWTLTTRVVRLNNGALSA